jgi:hypothetical protein
MRASDRITRRSQVQILSPLLEKPRKRGSFVLRSAIGGRNLCPDLAFTERLRWGTTSAETPSSSRRVCAARKPSDTSASAIAPYTGECSAGTITWSVTQPESKSACSAAAAARGESLARKCLAVIRKDQSEV